MCISVLILQGKLAEQEPKLKQVLGSCSSVLGKLELAAVATKQQGDKVNATAAQITLADAAVEGTASTTQCNNMT